MNDLEPWPDLFLWEILVIESLKNDIHLQTELGYLLKDFAMSWIDVQNLGLGLVLNSEKNELGLW